VIDENMGFIRPAQSNIIWGNNLNVKGNSKQTRENNMGADL